VVEQLQRVAVQRLLVGAGEDLGHGGGHDGAGGIDCSERERVRSVSQENVL
jgi:hypothetical protein